MTRSPPKKVYGNKRSGKMGSAVTYSTDKLVCQPLFHHSNATSSGLLKSYIHSSHNLEGNASSCLEAQPDLFEQPSTSSVQNEKKREHISVKKLFAGKSNNQSREVLKFAGAKPELSEQPSTSSVLNEKKREHFSSQIAGKPNIQAREVVLGIPLQHTYVNRKVHKNLHYLDTETETCYRATSNLKFECHEQIRAEPTDNNDDPSDLMEFLQGAKATLHSTFEEIVNDCPEFKASASIEKNNVLKQLRFYAQRQPVIQSNTVTKNMEQSPSQTSYYNVQQDPKSFVKFAHPKEFHGIETTTDDSVVNRFLTPVPTKSTPKLNSLINFPETFSRRFKDHSSTQTTLPRLRPTLLSNSSSSIARLEENSVWDSFSYGENQSWSRGATRCIMEHMYDQNFLSPLPTAASGTFWNIFAGLNSPDWTPNTSLVSKMVYKHTSFRVPPYFSTKK